MTHKQLLRRAGILCCHFLRNLAFYKSGWKNGKLVTTNQFFVNANGNFLDICVLEWCKLFGNRRGEHYWSKLVTDKDTFLAGLLQRLKLTENEFEDYVKSMRSYRDKFVAHLDTEEVMNLPKLRTARKSVSFLYDYLLSNEEVDDCFHDAPPNASWIYEHFSWLGRKSYTK